MIEFLFKALLVIISSIFAAIFSANLKKKEIKRDVANKINKLFINYEHTATDAIHKQSVYDDSENIYTEKSAKILQYTSYTEAIRDCIKIIEDI